MYWVFVAAHVLSLVVEVGLLIAELLTLKSMGSRVHRLQYLWHMGSGRLGFSSCSAWTLELDWVVAVHGFSCSAVVGVSWTRDLTHVHYIGRQTVNHWATREVPMGNILRIVAPEHEGISCGCLTQSVES